MKLVPILLLALIVFEADELAHAAPGPAVTIASLRAQLASANPPKVRVRAVKLLGQLGTEAALAAVADTFAKDEHAPARVSAAMVLGKSGQPRWIRLLATGLTDEEASVRNTCRRWTKELAKIFKEEKKKLGRFVIHVDLRGMRERTGRDDNELTTHFQHHMLMGLIEHDERFEFGEELDFEDEDATCALTSNAVHLLIEGALKRADAKPRNGDVDVRVEGDARLLLMPLKVPLSPRVKASARGRVERVDEMDEEIDWISPTIEALDKKLVEKLWKYVE